MAVRDGRTEDAAALAGQRLETDDANAVGALLEMARTANLMHKMPGSSVELLRGMTQDELVAFTKTDQQLSLELLTVVESMDGRGTVSEDAQQLLDGFKTHPGNGEVVKMLARVTRALLITMRARIHTSTAADRGSDAERFAFVATRALFAGDERPDPHTWQDPDAEPPRR